MRTALLIPVPEAETLVGDLRRRYDRAAETGIPAHVTVLAPFGDVDEGLDELFTAFEPFDFELTRVERWPGVLWLAPEPAERFVALTRAVAARYPEHQPYGGEHDTIIPHLTVGHHEEPPAELDTALQRGLPIAARATHVVQYEEVAPDRWHERRRYALRG
jgi:2'-5' RNA ligase